LWPVVATQQ